MCLILIFHLRSVEKLVLLIKRGKPDLTSNMIYTMCLYILRDTTFQMHNYLGGGGLFGFLFFFYVLHPTKAAGRITSFLSQQVHTSRPHFNFQLNNSSTNSINCGLVIDRSIPTALAPTPTLIKGTAYSQTASAAGAAQLQTLHVQLQAHACRPSFFQYLVRSQHNSVCMQQLQDGHVSGGCQLDCPGLYSPGAAQEHWQLTINYDSSNTGCVLCHHTAQVHSIIFACFLRWPLHGTAQTSCFILQIMGRIII